MAIQPILILGAGISGLVLAQSCKKLGIPFEIFDQDNAARLSEPYQPLTIGSSLPTLKSHLPQDVIAKLPDCFVRKEAVDAGEKGSFAFLDLGTGEPKFHLSPIERIHVTRARLRQTLMTGIHVQSSKTIKQIHVGQDAGPEGVTALFEDGTSVVGSLLVAADGTHSAVRALCHPDDHEASQLPVRSLGAAVQCSDSEISALRELDPFEIFGTQSKNDVFGNFSIIPAPTDPNTDSDKPATGEADKWLCQVNLSWPHRKNWLGRAEPTNIPNFRVLQFSLMKTMSADFVEPLKNFIHAIPNDVEIRETVLEDYVPKRTTAFGGRVVLVGSAAHAMVNFRNEGVDQAIIDATKLVDLIRPLAQAEERRDAKWTELRDAYDAEMVERTGLAVLASRQACLDAHQWDRIDGSSPLIKRELTRADLHLQDIQDE